MQGGIDGRNESTGYGVYLGIKNLLDNEWVVSKGVEKGLQGKKFIVQVNKKYKFNAIIKNFKSP